MSIIPQEVVPWNQVQQSIAGFFAQSMDIKTIWANQDGQEPAYPFGRLQFTSGPQRESLFSDQCVVGDCVQISQNQTMTVQLQVIAGGRPGKQPWTQALEYATRAITANDIPWYRQMLIGVDTSIRNIGPVIDLTALEGSSSVGRVSVDFDMVHLSVFEIPLDDLGGHIESTQLTTMIEPLGLDDCNVVTVVKGEC